MALIYDKGISKMINRAIPTSWPHYDEAVAFGIINVRN